jgi:hypothetical protein
MTTTYDSTKSISLDDPDFLEARLVDWLSSKHYTLFGQSFILYDGSQKEAAAKYVLTLMQDVQRFLDGEDEILD